MTQRRVENTRVHFWTFSPVSVDCILDLFDFFRLCLPQSTKLTEQSSFPCRAFEIHTVTPPFTVTFFVKLG